MDPKTTHPMKSVIWLYFIITANICTLSIYSGEMVEGSDNTQTQQLSMACWNSRGMVAALPYLNKILEDNDIVALSEHWLHSNRLNVLTELTQDFNVIGRASKQAEAGDYGYKQGQGGVALFWRKSLCGVSPITSLVHDRICGILLQSTLGNTLNILSVYMPSPGSTDDFDVVLDELAEIVESMEDGSLTLILRDFNGDVGHL